MPTPDGRSWLTSTEIASRITDLLQERYGTIAGLNRGGIQNVVKEAFELTNYHNELKIVRLAEKIKDAAQAGLFGPLYIPNTVDVNGEPIPTPVGVMASLLIDIYQEGFLDMHDEEGNPIEPPAGG